MGGTLRGPRTLLILTSLLVAIPFVAAQVIDSEEGGPKKIESMVVTTPGLRTVVTIDAEDTYLPTILSILAAKSGFNIVTGPGVAKEERISIHLKDTPIEEAMNLVVRAAGLSYEIIGNSFLVASAKKLKERVGENSYVLSLQYAIASEVKELLGDFPAAIRVDKSGNKLLIITTPKVITDIERTLRSIDKPPIQITLSVRLIEVSVENEERLGLNWSKMSTNTSWFLFEGSINPASTTTSGGTGGGAGTTGGSTQSLTGVRNTGQFEIMEDLNTIGTLWRAQPVWELALDWMIKNAHAEILTNTSVTTINADSAIIELIDKIPYVASAGGVGGSVNVKEEEVGIKLKIIPQVNTDGYITVSLEPEVSNLFEFVGPDQSVPRVVLRRAKMKVRVKNHQTIIVGGLMGITSTKVVHKVPFFGDIPYIGRLFRYNVESTRKTDLIIEVTPHILTDEYTYIDKSESILRSERKHLSSLEVGGNPESE